MGLPRDENGFRLPGALHSRRDDLSDAAYVRLSVLTLLRKIMRHDWRSGAMELRIVVGVLSG